ncbi:polyphosphate polymerase domain-containing protein [Clostridiaceae bacterium HSG29]|nr:polyphosphate polymerase domain-containing protein [Clostridiaceae bacterium HSG29]
MKFRHEFKYHINYLDYINLKSKLKKIMKQDSHINEKGMYTIKSLYFDNIYDQALFEKINGKNIREKFRIRMYNNDSSFIRLEKKSKIKNLTSKISTTMTENEVNRIINGQYQFLLESNNPLKIELYSNIKKQLLKPKTIVEYIREPFIYNAGNVRITLDREIKSGANKIDFFNKDLPLIEAAEEIILEVKYDGFLPDFIRNLIKIDNRMATSFSKYVVARVYG